MNKYPEYIEVNGKRYKINTDFRVALKCDEVYRDETIGTCEKNLAIIYLLLGDDGLNASDDYEEILKLLVRYLLRDKDVEDIDTDEEPSMSYKQDVGYIKASFMSDYNIDLDKVEMHYWQFFDLLQGLTENSILNRVRMIREEPLSGKKGKEREQWEKAKKQVALKREKTKSEEELDKFWEEQLKVK